MDKINAQAFFSPLISKDTELFWNSCNEKTLVFQKCGDCGHLRWPASFLCPECLGETTFPHELCGNGTVYSFEIFNKAFHPSLKDKVPYIVAQIDLDEGVRIISNIVGCTTAEVHCGMPVRVVWHKAEGYTRPVFCPL